ncbi:MAG: recombination mediator RecR [Alphaproteobacteria bacterium]|nr:recombination protein RecR [Alphaproteobacteria bacterium]MCQ2568176.1 recombination mediator RecR [Alphaproteobacteria bacterium]
MNIKIEKLIKQFAKLPRVGTRAATRMVIALLQDKTGRAESLAHALIDATEHIHPCQICGVLTDGEVCEYCADVARQNGELCIVRDFSDVLVLEKSGVFHGRYHVLGGMLSGVDGITPNDLNIACIAQRIEQEKINEIIFALPNTVEGKTTQQYIISTLNNTDVSFSELASGVPLGGDLDYIDDGTLTLAFGGRKKL